MGKRIAIAAVAALTVVVITAPAAQASVTLGSDLSPAPNAAISGNSTTLLQTSLPGARLTSPVNGLIVLWRAITGASATSAGVRVVRPLGTSRLFLSGASLVGLPAGGAAIPAAIPISAGDSVALDLNGTLRFYTPSAGTVYDVWGPHPGAGIAPPAISSSPDRDLYYNVDVEPTNTFALGAAVVDKKKGTAAIDITLPNVGTIEASPVPGPQTAKRAVATDSKRKRKRVTKALIAPFSVTSVGPGQVTLKLVPNRPTKKKLKRTGKASGQITFSYSPDFGSATTQTATVSLRLSSAKKKKRR